MAFVLAESWRQFFKGNSRLTDEYCFLQLMLVLCEPLHYRDKKGRDFYPMFYILLLHTPLEEQLSSPLLSVNFTPF